MRKSDEWDFDSFHIKATNEHDHSEVANLPRTFKIPQSLKAQMSYWRDHPLTPYSSWADIMRDALAHRFAYLANSESMGGLQEFRHNNNLQAMLQDIAADREFEGEMRQAIRVFEDRARELERAGDSEGLADLLRSVKATQVEPTFRADWLGMVAEVERSCDRVQ